MDQQPLEVKGIQVRSSDRHNRTVQLGVLVKDGEIISLNLEYRSSPD